ncbi:zinc finger CCCH domain-containing protein 20-like [Andrographis paniculata]|uniref:zinc finger CCCH domain-containing protein 20-like n=1 Tax=Andrographis paniculata TaxID=175694 RepID=UPI0021E81B10|nr:zinc finger CCCH domain-containing protein 20-like [Andrographis paniculata]
MLGERINGYRSALRLPPWIFAADSPTSSVCSPAAAAVDDYSNFFGAIDSRSSDHFHMFEFKVRMCTSAKSHDWTECPFAHPGEKARRRDPRKFQYSGAVCPDFRKGSCRRGSACEFAHGVFECWLHPARYRTQLCKDGVSCTRRVCFFAHSAEQLRVLSPMADHSLHHRFSAVDYSPESNSPSLSSPTIATMPDSVGEILAHLEQLQVRKVKPMAASSSPATRMARGYFEDWDHDRTVKVHWQEEDDDEAAMERVESGNHLRARMFEKLSRENPLSSGTNPDPNPDVRWISELVNN